MMNQPKSKINRILSAILASMLTASTVVPSVAAVTELTYPEGMNCVLISDDDALFNVEKAVIDGNIFAYDNIRFYGSDTVKVDGFASTRGKISEGITATKTDNNCYNVPDFSGAIERNATYGRVLENNTSINETDLDISDGIYAKGRLTLDEVTLKGQGYLTAEDTIKCDLIQGKNTDYGDMVIYSKNGNIIISGSELTINGIIYAPKGKITFNVKKLTVNGGIYAENVEFNGTELVLNKSVKCDALVTDKLLVDAGPDREIYVGDSLELEGVANYENVNYSWSGDESISFENADAQKTLASFSEVGTYTVKLTGTLDLLSASDTLTVKVNPDPSKTFTTDNDFSSGEMEGTAADKDALTLAKETKTVSEINKSYTAEGVSGINVSSTVSKDKITAMSDEFGITYNLKGVGSNISAEEEGVDFVFLIDQSGSMYGEYLTNAQEAAKTIISYMRPGDRYAISDLGRLHIGFTDDKELLEQEIENVKRGSGSSEMGEGLNIANQLFADESSENRQKYILLLTDGENFHHTLEQLHEIAQASAEQNIRIFSLAMHSEMQNMQDVAIITKGIYKHCPDAETIKTFMERFGAEIFNSAARNVLFKTTVADISKIDLENIAPAPSSVTTNDDGSAEIAWSMDTFEIDEEKEIFIPVKSDLFAESGYERVSYNTALYYNDKEGKGQKTYLDDVTLPCDTYQDNGTWSAVYDSNRENCQWTGIFWNGEYPSDSSADVYIAVSNDGVNYTADKKVVNYTVPDNLKGRYIRVRADLQKGSDGSAPVIDDITVISGTMKLSEPLDYSVSARVDNNRSVYANRPTTFYADIKSNSDSIKNISWTINGTDKYTLDDSNPLMPTVVFEEPGEYTITLKAADDSGKSAQSTVNINVLEEENVSDIVFEDGSEPVSYTVEGQFKYHKYYEDKALKLISDNPSAIAWVSVRFIPDAESYSSPSYYNRVWIYSIDEELSSVIRMPYYSGKVEITAYDWSGNPYKYEFISMYDTESPKVNLIRPESKYPNGYFYTQDPYTVTVVAEDNGEVNEIKLFVNEEEVALDENNSYTFTPTVGGSYRFRATVSDKAGNSSQNSMYQNIYEDNSLPRIYPFSLNRRSACIGNEIVFTSVASDNETGLKSVVYTINDEEITLDENNEYRYIASEAGEFLFKCVAEDNRGNIREEKTTLTVTEDTERPYVTISATRSREILVGTSAVVTVTATDNVAVTNIDVDVNGEAYTLDENNQFVLNAEAAGNLVITATAYDAVGNSRTTTYTLKAIDEDTTKPSTSISASNRYEYQNRDYSITVYSSDNTKVASRKLYLDGKELSLTDSRDTYAEYNYTDYYTINPTIIGIGEHTLKSVITDESGNTAEAEKIINVTDTTTPYISFSGGYYFNTDDDVVLTLTVTDNTEVESITGTLNDQPITLSDAPEQNLTIEKAPAGKYVFSITAKDIYGNERTETRTITVRDTQKPVITLSDVKEEYIIPEMPVIRMTVTDNIEVASVTVKMNNEDLEYDGNKIVLPDTLAEGDYTIYITAKDTNNNTASETIKFSVSMPKDTTPPVIESVSIIPEHPEIGSPIEITVQASDDSGSVDVEVSTNGTKFTNENGVFVYTPQTAGEIVVTIKATDPSGNVTEITATGYVNEDITSPVVSADYQSSMTVNQSQTITVSATDNKSVSSLSLQINGSNVSLTNGQYVFTPNSTGSYNFTALATDSAGNVGTKSFTVEVTEKQDETALKAFLVNRNETAVDSRIEEFTQKYNSPAKVYEYTKNYLYPEFYGGSRKGATAVLEQGGGNDVDTASFLIAALRKLGYPARYATGTVMYSEDELKALTGAEDVASAIDTLNTSDYESQPYYTSSGKKLLGIKHTWVEVYVPDSMTGGTGNNSSWVTLDPWYKTCTLEEGKVEAKDTSKDLMYLHAQQVIDDLSAIEKEAGSIESVSKLKNFFTGINEEKSTGTSYKIIKLQKVSLSELPKSPEFYITNKDKTFADVDDDDRDMISFSIGGTELAKINTYGISAKNILLQYVPATDNDKTTLDNAGGNWKKTGMGISVVPVITADGKELGRGSAVSLGTEQKLTTTIRSAGTSKSFTDTVGAGNMYAIVTNVYDISANDIESAYTLMANYAQEDKDFSPYSEELLGSLLNYAGKMYYSLNDRYEEIYCGQYNMNVTPKISVGVFGYEFGTRTNFYGNVTGLKDGRFMTDIDEYTFTAVSRDSNAENRRNYILSNGCMSSYLEGYVWSFITDVNGLSTMSVLSAATFEGVDILNITEDNLSDIYSTSLSDEVISDIVSHVREGYSVIVPAKEITIDDWTGTGYIMLDNDNLEKSYYRLSDTINGGGESLTIALDEVMSKGSSDIYKNGGWHSPSEDPNNPSYDPLDRKPNLPKESLKDGIYTVTGTIYKADKSGISRANGAMKQEVMLTVQGGKIYVSPDFHGLTVDQTTGYINSIEYYDWDYTTDEEGRPQGTCKPVTVNSFQKDDKGTTISDSYGTNYPKRVTFPLIASGFETGMVPLRITANVIESAAPGKSVNPVYLFLDWNTLQYKSKTTGAPGSDPDEGSGDQGGGSGGSGSGTGEGGSGSGSEGNTDPGKKHDEYYEVDIDLEKLINKVYRIRVMIATLRLHNATLSMSKAAYSPLGKDIYSDASALTGAAGEMVSSAIEAKYASYCLFDARKMLLDFYSETGDQKPLVLEMMSRAYLEADACINSYVLDEYNEFVKSLPDPTDPDYLKDLAKRKAQSALKDKVMSMIPDPVKKAGEKAGDYLELYLSIVAVNQKLHELAYDDPSNPPS